MLSAAADPGSSSNPLPASMNPASKGPCNKLPSLYALLAQITLGGPDVQAASHTLSTHHYRNVSCIPDLYALATGAYAPETQDSSTRNQAGAVRQLAAIELRKQVRRGGNAGSWWASVPEPVRTSMKAGLLTRVLAEPSHLIQHSLARVISEIANHELTEDRWPELMEFCYTCCAASGPMGALQREIGVYILYTLFEVIADVMAEEHLGRLFALFSTTIRDPESHAVRTTTLQALGKVAEFIEPEDRGMVTAFQALIPAMGAVLQECLATGDADGCTKCFDVFDSLLVLEAPLLSAHLPDLLQFFVGVASNLEVEASFRVNALSFLMWCTVYKKSRLVKFRLVQPLVAALFPIGAEPEPEDEDEDCPSKLAFQIISSLAMHLAPAQVYPDVMTLVEAHLGHADARLRKAAMLAFAVLVDGCSDHMSTRLDELIPLLVRGLQDPEAVVRKGACMALGSLAEKLDVEVASYHAVLMPLVSTLLQQGDVHIQYHVLAALDAFLEGLGDDILPYLPSLMERLVTLLQREEDAKVRLSAVGCLGSAAHAAGDAFSPFFSTTIQQLMPMLSLGEEEEAGGVRHEDLDLRGVATDTVAAVAEAVGREAFAPYAESAMNLVMQGLTIDSCRLRECSYCFFGVVARVFSEDFAHFLPAVVPAILASCRQEEPTEGPSLDGLGAGDEGADVLSQDDDHRLGHGDDEDVDPGRGFQMNSAIAEEKETSADALGELFAATKSAFLPYLEEALKTLIALLDHYHAGVRKSAITALFLFLQTFHTAILFPNAAPGEWEKGLPMASLVDANFASMIRLVIEGVLATLQDEDDRLVVAQSLEEMADTLKAVGPTLVCHAYAPTPGQPEGQPVATHLDALCNMVLRVLQKEHLCQSEDLEDDGDPADEQEQAEQDAVLIAGAANCVAALALAVGGAGFVPYFERFLPLIAMYYKRNRPANERSLAIGALGECVAGMGPAITPFTGALAPLLTKALQDEEEDIRSNACFAIGSLIEHSSVDLSAHYPRVLQLFQPLLPAASATSSPAEAGASASETTVSNAVDNACGAISRILCKAASGTLPVEHILPVLLAQLPLRRDFAENEPVFRCLMMLVERQEPAMLAVLPTVLEKVGLTLAMSPVAPNAGEGNPVPVLKPPTKAALAGMLRQLQGHWPAWHATLPTLSPAAANALAVLLHG